MNLKKSHLFLILLLSVPFSFSRINTVFIKVISKLYLTPTSEEFRGFTQNLRMKNVVSIHQENPIDAFALSGNPGLINIAKIKGDGSCKAHP